MRYYSAIPIKTENSFVDLQRDIHHLFNISGQDISVLKINNAWYKEIINYSYLLSNTEIKFISELHSINPNTQADYDERVEILTFFNNYDFISDINTRQAVLQLKYEEDMNKASCIPCIHVLIRGNKLYVNVYMRSSNYTKNWLFDQQTFALLVTKLQTQYQLDDVALHVHIASLHTELSSEELLKLN